MSSNDINIRINADDNASGDIKTVEQSMERMGKTAKETSSALRKFASGGRAGAAALKLMGDSLAEVNKLGTMASRAFGDSMSKMARSIDPSINKSRVLTTTLRDLMRVADNPELKAMGDHYRSLERGSRGAASGSRVLTTTMQDLMRVPVNTVLKDMGKHYRELERTSKKAAVPGADVAEVMNRQGREAFFAKSKMDELKGATDGFAKATKEVTSTTKQATAAVKGTGRAVKATKSSLDEWVKHADAAAGKIVNVFQSVGRMIRRTIIVGVGAATVALAALGRLGIQYNGQMDTYQTMMTTYLGDAKEASKLLLEAQDFAMKTPLDTAQVMKSATMLIQYGSSAKEAMGITKRLADVSAGSSEKMHLLGIAMSQVAAKGRLQAEEVRQLTNAGYNPLKTIAAQTGKTMKDVMADMKKGEVSFKDVQKALIADTSAAVGANKAFGKFHGNVLALAKTLPGAVANIKEMGKALTGHATKEAYAAMTKVAVATQHYMGILTRGVLKGKGWAASFEDMSRAMRKAGGSAAWVGKQLQRVINSDVVQFGIAFKKSVRAELAKGATFRVAVRTSLGKSEGGAKSLAVFDGMKNTFSKLMPIVKSVMGFIGTLLVEVGKRAAKLIDAFRDMGPLFTNVIGPLVTGVFKGILSVVDPIISAIAWLAPWIGKFGTSMEPFAKRFEQIGYVIGMLFGGPILAGVGKLTKGFGLIGKAVAPLGGLLNKVGGFVFKIVAGVVKLHMKFLGGFVKLGVVVAQFFARFTSKWLMIVSFPARMYLKFVWAIAKMTSGFAKGAVNMGVKFIQNVHNMGGALGKMVSKFVGMMIAGVAKIGSGIKKLGGGLGKAIGSATIGLINKAIDGINDALDRIRNVSILGKKPMKGLPTIPRLGDGGSFSSGSAIVGERGAELLTMSPRGATITPARHLTERRGATAGSLRSAIERAAGADGTIEVAVTSPVMINEREIARAVTRHTIKKVARR